MRLDVSKLVRNGLYKEAICLYRESHSASLSPRLFTFPPLLKACAKLKATPQGQILHAHIIKTAFSSDTYTATALTDMYMKLHMLNDATKAFDKIPDPNLASLNAIIGGFSRNGCYEEAFRAFRKACLRNPRPNSVTIASTLVECGSFSHGRQMHCWAAKLGVEDDVYVATAVLTMYANCAEIASATKMFELLRDKNAVSYNAFISGLLVNGVYEAVLAVFRDMRADSDEDPNYVTFVSILSACSRILHLQFGKQVHEFALKFGVCFDKMVGTALVDMYLKCGSSDCAFVVFEEMGCNRNLITWNSMIAGMMLNGQWETAVELFEQLGSHGLEPDSATWNCVISGFSHLGKGKEAFEFFNRMRSTGINNPSSKSITSLLSACSAMVALRRGKEIHGYTIRKNLSEDEFLATGLTDMYMKCGAPSWAQKVFDQFEGKNDDPAIWNAMIIGHGRNGDTESAFEIFYEMLEKKVKANTVTLNCVLSICSHAGWVDKSLEIFRMMKNDYGVDPSRENVGCLVDLLGRSGKLATARELIEEIENPHSSVFASLLGACKSYSDAHLGEEMARKLSVLEPDNPVPFVILSSIYAEQGRWSDLESVREMINDAGLKKRHGYSLIAAA